MADIATLALAVDSRPVADASEDLDRITASAKKAEDAATGFGKRTEDAGRRAAAANDNVARSANKVTAAYDKWHTAARRVAAAVGAIAGALAVRALTSYADAWSDMQSRVGAAVRDMEAAPALMQRMVDIANASYSPLDQTVEVYSRNVAVLRDLGRGASDAADFTEALNHALVLTATRGERAASVQNALSKAMAVGKLQAEGLETILAHGGEVAQVLADELGTNVNGLRAMASAGKITGDVIANALITRLDDLRDRAAEMPATIGDAFTRLQTNLTAFIGQLDQTTGASQTLAAAIMLVADNIDVIARVAAVAGVALLTAFAPTILAAMASGLVTIGTAGVAAMRALTIAIAANPIGALVVAITTAVTAAYLFRDEIKQAIGIDFVAIIEGAINTVVGVFVGGFEAIKASWSMLPAALGDLAYSAANAVIGGVESMVNGVASRIDGFIAKINSAIASLPFGIGDGVTIGPIGSFDFGRLDNPYAGAASSAADAARGALSDAMSRNYVGALKEMVFGTRTAAEATAGLDNAVAKLNDSLGETGGGKGGGAAAKAAKAVKDVADAAKDASKAALDFGKDLVKGFVSDLRSGLDQGKGLWRSFGDAALNVLDKVIDKLLNNMINAIFEVGKAGSSIGGGGGGFFGGLFGWIGKLFGFAKGGVFQDGVVQAFAKGGVVERPTVFPFAKGVGLMGEAGPEAIMPLRRGRDGRLGVEAANANRQQPLVIYVVGEEGNSFVPRVRQVSGATAEVVVRERAPQIVGAAVAQSTARVIPTVARYQQETAGSDYR